MNNTITKAVATEISCFVDKLRIKIALTLDLFLIPLTEIA